MPVQSHAGTRAGRSELERHGEDKESEAGFSSYSSADATPDQWSACQECHQGHGLGHGPGASHTCVEAMWVFEEVVDEGPSSHMGAVKVVQPSKHVGLDLDGGAP